MGALTRRIFRVFVASTKKYINRSRDFRWKVLGNKKLLSFELAIICLKNVEDRILLNNLSTFNLIEIESIARKPARVNINSRIKHFQPICSQTYLNNRRINKILIIINRFEWKQKQNIARSTKSFTASKYIL